MVVQVVDLEDLPIDKAEAKLKELAEAMQPGDAIEFTLLNWQYLVEYSRIHGPDQQLVDLVHKIRVSVWDERAIATAMLMAGFFKVWTGHVEGLQPWEMLVKAVKAKVMLH